ncbi:MAG: DUF1854 domain-containing protein [Gemmataceae bacterium]
MITVPTPTPKAVTFRLDLDGWGQLVLTDADGRSHVGVEPVRCFPLSDPSRGIVVCDQTGHELVWIPDLAELPTELRGCLEDALASREFMPVLVRILAVSAGTEPSEWDVETDRGRTRFRLSSEDDVRRLSADRAMITDASGVRYLVPNLRKLDDSTARVLERYL